MRQLPHIQIFPADLSARRRRVVKSLAILGSLLAFLSAFAIWIERQALSTDDWVQTSSGMLENAQIRGAVSEFLVEKLYENVDVEAELESILPGVTKELAGGLADGAEGVAEGGAEAALETSVARTLWETANRTAHEELLEVLEDKNEFVGTGGGDVSLNLSRLLDKLAEELGVSQSVVEKLPAGAAQIEIVHSDQLNTAQTVVSAIKGLALILSLLTLGAFALAIYLSCGARGAAVLFVGAGLVAAGLAILLLRIVAGHLILDQLVTNSDAEPAAEAAWSIGTSLLADIARTVVVSGALFLAAGWLASASEPAVRVRGLLAPTLQRWPAFFYAGLIAILAIFLLSGSADGLRTTLTAFSLAGFAVLGIRALRDQTIREFPDAGGSASVARLGQALRESPVGSWASRLSELRPSDLPRRQGADRPGDPTPDAAATDVATPVDEETRLERLAQLGTLRDRGILDEREFLAEKNRLLGNPPEADGRDGPSEATG